MKLYPQINRQKGTLKVEVRILEPDEWLRPDMSVRITFLREAQAGAPAARARGARAARGRAQRGRRVVRVGRDATATCAGSRSRPAASAARVR